MSYRSEAEFLPPRLVDRIFQTEGELARLCRDKDWSATPLGPVERWSASLRAVAGLVVASPTPMVVLWGAQLVQIYNDGYRDVLGRKHPAGLGQPRRECWPEASDFYGPICERVFERGETFTFENQRLVLERYGDPEELFFNLAYSPAIDDAGNIGGVLVTVSETTAAVERADAEKALRESEERYRLIGRATNDIIWDWNLESSQLDWNETMFSHLGHTPNTLGATIESWYSHIHPEDHERVVSSIHDAIDSGSETWSSEYRFRRSDGSYAVFLDRGYIARDRLGKAYRMIGSMLDLTERRRMEEALRESEERLSRALEVETVGVLFFELPSSRFLSANDTFLRMAGMERDVLERGELDSSRVTLPEWMPRTWQALEELQTMGRFSAYEKEMIRPDGSRWWGVFAGAKLSGNECVEFVVDVTEQKQIESALRESEANFRAVADLVPDLLWRADAAGARVWSNRRWTEYTGQPPEAALGHGWAESIHAADRESIQSQFQAATQVGKRFRHEHRVRRADGTYRWFLSEAVPVSDNDGRITQWFGSATDIHDQHAAMDRLEELVKMRTRSLAESEERFRLLVTTSAQIIWSTDAEGRFIEDCPSWRAFTGQSVEGWMDGKFLEMVHPQDVPDTLQKWRHAIETRTPFFLEYRLWHASSGAWRWAVVHGVPLWDGQGEVTGWFGTCTDIDERKRAEEEVRHMAYRLTMAEQEERRRISQILHDDLQQLLYGLQLKLRMVGDALQSDEQPALAGAIGKTRDLLKQAIDTTRQLTVDLSPPILKSEGLADALEWLQRQMRELHGLKIELCTGQGIPPLDEDLRVLLFQIVRELLFNVKKHAGVDHAHVALERTGTCLTIRVEDEGQGMKLSKLDEREGTGFGLSRARERLRQIGGHMEFASAVGRGTRVTFQAPLHSAWFINDAPGEVPLQAGLDLHEDG